MCGEGWATSIEVEGRVCAGQVVGKGRGWQPLGCRGAFCWALGRGVRGHASPAATAGAASEPPGRFSKMRWLCSHFLKGAPALPDTPNIDHLAKQKDRRPFQKAGGVGTK